jgi:hypothetical protein
VKVATGQTAVGWPVERAQICAAPRRSAELRHAQICARTTGHPPRSPIATHVTRAVCSSQSAFAQWRRTLRELSARHSPRAPSGDARLRELSARHSPRSPSGDARYASCLLVTVRVRPVATHVTRAVCSSQSAFAQWRRTLRELSARHSPRSPSGDARYASCLLVTVRVRRAATHVYASCLLVTVRVRPAATHVYASCLPVTVRVRPVATHVLRELVARRCPRPPSATHACSSLVVSVRSPVQSAFIRSHAFSAS